MKHFVVLRGLPGAGKSTTVTALRLAHPKLVVGSADHYFERSGEYRFDPSKLGEAHAACKAVVMAAFEAGVTCVVLDNTNTQRWEYQPYTEAAERHGYGVTVIPLFDGGLSDAELAARNTHGVPEASIARMRARWEP